jgi:hypothetical protein
VGSVVLQKFGEVNEEVDYDVVGDDAFGIKRYEGWSIRPTSMVWA